MKITYLNLIASLILFLCACSAHEQKAPEDSSDRDPQNIVFCGSVEILEVLPDSDGLTYIAVDVDPNYYFTVKTDRPIHIPGVPRDDAEPLIFGIHSPAYTFKSDSRDIIGNRFEFVYRPPNFGETFGRLSVSACNSEK